MIDLKFQRGHITQSRFNTHPFNGKLLKEKRREFKLTQLQLGKSLGYQVSYRSSVISGWELNRERPSLDREIQLEKFFNVPEKYFRKP